MDPKSGRALHLLCSCSSTYHRLRWESRRPPEKSILSNRWNCAVYTKQNPLKTGTIRPLRSMIQEPVDSLPRSMEEFRRNKRRAADPRKKIYLGGKFWRLNSTSFFVFFPSGHELLCSGYDKRDVCACAAGRKEKKGRRRRRKI